MQYGTEENKQRAMPPLVRVLLGASHPSALVALALATIIYGVIFCRSDHAFWLSLTAAALLTALGSTSLAYRRKIGLSRGSFVAARVRMMGYWLGFLAALLAPFQTHFLWYEIAVGGISIGHWAGRVGAKMATRKPRSDGERLLPDTVWEKGRDT